MARVQAVGNAVPVCPGVAEVIELPDDFRDLLIELADAGAEFVVVGGHAVAFHGHVRATKDLDVLVRGNRANAERVYRALARFGAPLATFDVSEADFAGYEGVLQIGLPPLRIDILNRASGITFDEAVADGAFFQLDGRRVPVIGLKALLKNKAAANRDQDRADVKALSPSKR
jgi:predicted nucleotidyltransferase